MNTLEISVNPTSGLPGTAVTITGTGFGASQGSGAVQLGSTAGQVTSWSDTLVVAAVAPGALSGIARIQQNGTFSNAVAFTVPAPGGGGNTVVPGTLNMVVGDTHAIQALSAAGQSVTGLTWTSSDPAVVSLSTADPPVLTAVAAGHVTITAGSGSADVTVSTGALALGTVIWSNPGDGSGVAWMVPAVPSPSGVADVFAIQNDGTVHAITSDGATAWTADVSQAVDYSQPGYVVPDFQGGLVVVGQTSIWKLDGITGQPYPAYTPVDANRGAGLGADGGQLVAVHPDGTIFAIQRNLDLGSETYWDQVIGIDPTTGTQKFGVTLNDWPGFVWGLIIAGDGYAYVASSNREFGAPGSHTETNNLNLLRVNSSGASDNIGDIYDWVSGSTDILDPEVGMITNADQGILLTWAGATAEMAITTGASASLVSAPQVPGGVGVTPVLQAQDGSFVGSYDVWSESTDSSQSNMVAFDASRNVRWMVPNEQPRIATADGGVIGQSGITYDQNGNATGQMNLLTQSWTGNLYEDGDVRRVAGIPAALGTTFWAVAGGNVSDNQTAAEPLPDRVNAVYDEAQTNPLGAGAVQREVLYRLFQGTHSVGASRGAVITEVLTYVSGQKPSPSSTLPGEDFDDVISTSGKGPFVETQRITVTLPAKSNYPAVRAYPVLIVPCTVQNTWGNSVGYNALNVTSSTVLINNDPGSTEARTCKPQ